MSEIARCSGVMWVSVSLIVNQKTHKRMANIAERNLPPLPRRRPDQQRPAGKRKLSAEELARWITRRR